MLGFLFGFLTFSRVRSTTLRIILIVITIGLVIAGLLYAFTVFSAVTERNQAPHVQHHTTP